MKYKIPKIFKVEDFEEFRLYSDFERIAQRIFEDWAKENLEEVTDCSQVIKGAMVVFTDDSVHTLKTRSSCEHENVNFNYGSPECEKCKTPMTPTGWEEA